MKIKILPDVDPDIPAPCCDWCGEQMTAQEDFLRFEDGSYMCDECIKNHRVDWWDVRHEGEW